MGYKSRSNYSPLYALSEERFNEIFKKDKEKTDGHQHEGSKENNLRCDEECPSDKTGTYQEKK